MRKDISSISDLGKGPPVNGNHPIFTTTGWRNDLTLTIDVRAYGAVGNGVSDDTAPINAALLAGAGKTVVMPAATYLISAPLVVGAKTTIQLEAGTIIEQIAHYRPVFDINLVDDVAINGNGGLLRYLGARTWTAGTTTRGGAEAIYGAGIWTSGDRTKVRRLRVYGFVAGVNLSGWNGTTMAAYDKSGNVVEDISVDTVDFGVLWAGQDNPSISRIRGNTMLETGSPNPSHLLYGSDAARNRNIAVSDCEAWDIADSFAFQFKGQDGGTIKNLTARNTAGLLASGGAGGAFNTDLVYSNLNGASIGNTSNSGAVYFQGNDLRVRIDGLNLHQAVSDRAIRLDGTDCTIANAKVRTRHDTQADFYDVVVVGTRNVIDGISIVNIDDAGSDYTVGWRGFSLTTAVDCAIRPLTIRNTRIGIEVTAAATRPRIDLSQADIVLATTSGISKLIQGSSGGIVVPEGHSVGADVGNTAKTLTALVSERTQVWNSPLTADRAVTLSTTNAFNGATFHIVRTAASTGAFNLNVGTGPLKALAAGQWADVSFNGTSWMLASFGAL